ncbi:hypothetical protein HQQ80_18360 [Microbacteriaceae bacterium VKM Ac-2855]|nr:hypothetical protein [Microbacteriaceae bacterium VKM Ac-2855]
MTGLDIPLLEESLQWTAESLQVVNWGGFEGHRSIPFSPRSTLVSGASGTGKSTLLDAYLAVMMPSDVPFNGASNDATVGRARGAEQRNLLTYLRGKVDSTRDPATGQLRDKNLRGTDGPTWGAVGATFVSGDGNRYTALRMYIVPRRATRNTEIAMTLATVEGDFDLRRLEAFVPRRFEKGELEARVPGLVVRETYAQFAYALHSRLGIGASGDGNRAMRLLARIQAGQNLPSVDGLYKSMVLERPSTYEAADRAIAHFGALDEAYEAMVTESQKAKVLERIPQLHADLTAARESARSIDSLGVTQEGDTPFSLWIARSKDELLGEEIARNRRDRTEAQATHHAAKARQLAADVRLGEISEQIRDNGGDARGRLARQVEELQERHDGVAAARAVFESRTAVLETELSSRAHLDIARSSATRFLEDLGDRQSTLQNERDALLRSMLPLENRNRALRKEKDSLGARNGSVSTRLHNARVELARAAGLDPAELPFVAELLDLRPGEEHWRTAVEVSLHSLARILLIDGRKLDAFSRAIDRVKVPFRISFEGVTVQPHTLVDTDQRMISGKLLYKDSPFSTWIQDRVQAPHTDALCVDGAAELGGGGRRVTAAGQTRDGSRGAHGELGGAPIIGFTSEHRLAAIDVELLEVAREIEALGLRRDAVSRELTGLVARRSASEYLLAVEWASIDVATVRDELDRIRAAHDALLASSDVLRALEEQKSALLLEADASARERYLSDERVALLDAEHGRLVDQQDAVTTLVDRIETSGTVQLDEDQIAQLDALFASVGDARELRSFDANVQRLRHRLNSETAGALDTVQRATAGLTSAFETFQFTWPDPNLGTGVESYEDYRAILDRILETGLHARRLEWTRRLSRWSGEDLVPLSGAFDNAVEEIEDRLMPVNAILATLPFGAQNDSLKIVLRRQTREDVLAFRRELKKLSSGATETLTDDQLEKRFASLRRFMETIRDTSRTDSGAKTGPSRRDYFLDVRRHVEITAVRYRRDGTDVSVYSSLGDKSGGETQELIAFIVGAALRYQLGDETRDRPRFAPVFLDEAFIKADSEFAGRAVSAWLKLGFQLIVGAPLDKVTALEPYMDSLLSMTKDTETGHSHVYEITKPGDEVA